jgi:hypothetical protein
MKRTYTVSQTAEGVWYAHKAGFSYIPVLGSASKSKAEAQRVAANCMGLTLAEYRSCTS